MEPPKVEKPQILEGLKPVTVKPGEDAVFQAKVKGPIKQAKWYKNGKELEHPQIEQSGDTYKLIVPRAQEDDQGDYKVVFSNEAGSADSSAPLTVKPPPAVKPGFVKGLTDQCIPVDQPLELEIKTTGSPTEVQVSFIAQQRLDTFV